MLGGGYNNMSGYASFGNSDNRPPTSAGGFLSNSPAHFSASQQQTDSPARPNSSSGSSSHTIRPVTIRQLNHHVEQVHPDAPLKLDNAEFSNITFVGIIRAINEASTIITYLIEDGTGSIEAKVFVGADSSMTQSPELAEAKVNVYVRVYGKLKIFNGKKSFSVSQMRVVRDFNEVTYHHLDAIQAHLYFTKGALHELRARRDNVAKSTSGFGNPGVHNPMSNDMSNMGAYSSENAGFNNNDLNEACDTPIKSAIFRLVKQNSDYNEGANISFVERELSKQGFSGMEVRETIQDMVDNGIFYNTDDDHIRTCE
ncbi:hypothetical protein BKA69DRAFT_1086100 [Paraphysoderma sedebokerense]|nr:hypothetical protein BKA69DRAFT_1086100 [Paraphysoderma sedebokerense]